MNIQFSGCWYIAVYIFFNFKQLFFYVIFAQNYNYFVISINCQNNSTQMEIISKIQEAVIIEEQTTGLKASNMMGEVLISTQSTTHKFPK